MHCYKIKLLSRYSSASASSSFVSFSDFVFLLLLSLAVQIRSQLNEQNRKRSIRRFGVHKTNGKKTNN